MHSNVKEGLPRMTANFQGRIGISCFLFFLNKNIFLSARKKFLCNKNMTAKQSKKQEYFSCCKKKILVQEKNHSKKKNVSHFINKNFLCIKYLSARSRGMRHECTLSYVNLTIESLVKQSIKLLGAD